MLKSIIAALALAIVLIAPAQAQILDRPAFLTGVDIFKLEDQAIAQWEETLPKYRDSSDFRHSWERVKGRLESALVHWGIVMDESSSSPSWESAYDMWKWCLVKKHEIMPEPKDPDAAKKFGTVDVRGRLCEEKLPKKAEAKPVSAAKPKKTKKRR